MGDLLTFQDTKEAINVQDIQFSFSEEEGKEIEYVLEKGKEVYQEYQPFEKSSFINPEKLILENFHNSLQNLDGSFQNYEKMWDEIQSLIIDFKPVYEEKKRRTLARTYKNYLL